MTPKPPHIFCNSGSIQLIFSFSTTKIKESNFSLRPNHKRNFPPSRPINQILHRCLLFRVLCLHPSQIFFKIPFSHFLALSQYSSIRARTLSLSRTHTHTLTRSVFFSINSTIKFEAVVRKPALQHTASTVFLILLPLHRHRHRLHRIGTVPCRISHFLSVGRVIFPWMIFPANVAHSI